LAKVTDERITIKERQKIDESKNRDNYVLGKKILNG
jgi:hypothetical protein